MARPSPLAATTGQSSSRSCLCARLGADATAAKPNPWPTRAKRGRDSGHLLPPQEGLGHRPHQLHFCRSEACFGPHRRKTGPGGPNYHLSSAMVWGLTWRPRTSDDSGGPSQGKDGPPALRAIINNACEAPASSPTHPGHVTKEAEETNKEP